jgi:hypothetical protein
MNNAGFEFRHGQETFSFPEPTIPGLGPTQSPIQWIPGLLRGVKATRTWPLAVICIYCRGLSTSGAMPLLPLFAFMA